MLCCVLLVGCDFSGSGHPYPGASVYEASDKSFHFHYLAPPWKKGQVENPSDLAYFFVDTERQYNRSDPITISHKLWIREARGATPELAIQAYRGGAAAQGYTNYHDVTPFKTRSGAEGIQYMAYNDQAEGRFFFRESLMLDANQRIVRFSFYTAYPVHDQDIEDLVLSFDAAPDDGTETPGALVPAKPTSPDGGAP